MAEITLQESFSVDRGDENKDEDKLILSTIHQAKGLEWEAVFIINMTADAFPHPRAVKEGEMEEERRLFYVAATRAKSKLYLTYSISGGQYYVRLCSSEIPVTIFIGDSQGLLRIN